MSKATRKYVIQSYRDGNFSEKSDMLCVEEPLEIYAECESERHVIATTMRTPGNDAELAAGFLFTEGLIHAKIHIEQSDENVVTAFVSRLEFERIKNSGVLDRRSFVNTSCGICGRFSIEDLRQKGARTIDAGYQISVDNLQLMPDKMRHAQNIFTTTGGLHAAALFDHYNEVMVSHEDVGRHNAVDKVIGKMILQNRDPIHQSTLLVSGRLSFEIIQKALMAGIPIVAAVSAPSNLAVKVANEFNQTLVGFLRGDRFNIYSGAERIIQAES